VKLQTLKPRVQRANLLRVATLSVDHHVERMTGRRLQERNARYRDAHPLCERCEPKGIIRAVVEIDHRIPLHLGGPDTEDNLQGLCKQCHDEKSAQEARDRAEGVGMHAGSRECTEPVLA
jgi:5-methylcytosine-specific restriction protein A